MRRISSAIFVMAALFATEASAQSINLTGAYKCAEACRNGLVGSPAFITQNGADLNLLNEAGQPARAWPDWTAPVTGAVRVVVGMWSSVISEMAKLSLITRRGQLADQWALWRAFSSHRPCAC